MDRLVFILIVSFGTLFLGYGILLASLRTGAVPYDRFRSISSFLKLSTLVLLNPIPIVNSFWKLSLSSIGLAVFPFLGILSLVVGGGAAIAAIRIFRIPPYRAGSVFTCGMFTNLGAFGALIGFVLYGDLGYSLVQLFTMFEIFIYYAVGFPLSAQIAGGGEGGFRFDVSRLAERKAGFIPLGSIVAGSILNVTGVPHPDVLDSVSEYLIPIVTALLSFSIGITLRISRIRMYRLELGLIAAIKFVVIPLVIIPTGFLLGLDRAMGGVPLRVLAILSFMPVAFTALIPPSLYDFDLDLANSGWIVTTFSLLAIVPILFFVLS